MVWEVDLSVVASPEGASPAGPRTRSPEGPVAADSPSKSRSRFRGHLPALDGVRGLAILMVLLYHFVAQTTATNRFETVVNRVLSYGPLGVDLFFILSGFLITGILYDSCRDPSYFRSFYMRRVLRIFPLYYLVLAAVFLVVPLVPFLRGSELAGLREHQVWAWLYGVNVYLAIQKNWAFKYLDHFWSLSIEEHFYFVWPLVVWLLGRRPRALMGVALGIAATCFAGHLVASLAGVNPVVTMVFTPFQLDALCLGGFFAIYARQPGGEAAIKRPIVPMAAVAVAVLALQFGFHRFTNLELLRSLRSGMFRILLAALLLQALVAPLSSLGSRFFRSAPMVALGKYSYGLYVYHHFFSYYFTRHGTEFALARVVGSHTLAVAIQAASGIAVSVAIAWLSYELFEKHFLRLKRFWPSTKEPAARATA